MHFLYKGALATSIAGAGSIGAYYGIRRLNTVRIEHKLKNRLLSTKGDENKLQWETRLSSLRKSVSTTLTSELQEIKDTTKNKTWESLRDLCLKRSKEEYKSEDLKLKETIDYCTFKNKDKLGSKVIDEALESGNLKSNGKWHKVSESLKTKTDVLSSSLKKIQNKLKASSSPEVTALRTWCETIYDTPWINDEDPDFKDSQQYCLSDD